MKQDIFVAALKDAIRKLDPRVQIENPVMFVTFVGAIMTTPYCFSPQAGAFVIQISAWLWFTVLFANFAEALAEGRGKARADSLRRAKTAVCARRLDDAGHEAPMAAGDLRKGDRVVCEAGDVIPGDGEVIEGIASVDESAITGESAPVIRESGGDRSAVTGGTRVNSDRIVVRITVDPGGGFIDRMIALVEGAKRQKTPNEIALGIVLIGLTIIFLLAVASLKVFADFAAHAAAQDLTALVTVPVLIALLVCLIPTTIGGLLSAIGISGMDRLIQKNVIATSGRAVEAAGDVDVLLMDKTGTITLGNRVATEFLPVQGVALERLAQAAGLSSLGDETPEGRSIISLAGSRAVQLPTGARVLPFSAQTRMSGVDYERLGRPRRVRKGAATAVEAFARASGGIVPPDLADLVDRIARKGGTPLVVCEDAEVLGVIYLKDVIKGGMRERFAELRRMGIRTVMITGDNPVTAAAIAAEAGVDDFLAQATPEDKLRRIREEQARGHLVAMTGDGTNDAPALAQADVGVAMNTGTQAAREAGNMVDLDSNPTKLIEIVEIGKQLLMTRGSLTTFSIANDVAKYFAILPALFGTLYAASNGGPGPLGVLNVMGLASPHSAILSAVIFNALVIVALIPLALRGVPYRAAAAGTILVRNLAIYGVGGLITPFAAIKLIDMFLNSMGLI